MNDAVLIESVRTPIGRHGGVLREVRPDDLAALVRSADEGLGQPTTSLGLGLFIVKEVVNAHGGTIEVSSNKTDGTLFTVVLPRNG